MLSMNKQSSKFHFKRVNRGVAVYSENDRFLDLEVDPGANAGTLFVYIDGPLRWRDGSKVSAEDRERIKSNLESLNTGQFSRLIVK